MNIRFSVVIDILPMLEVKLKELANLGMMLSMIFMKIVI